MKAKLCMLLTLFVSIAFGQNTIKGTLISPEQKPVDGANVLLLSLPDSTLVKGAISGADGTFELPTATGAKAYCLKITHLSYRDNYIPNPAGNLGVLTMEQAANELGEVVVKTYRPVLKQEGTRVITNVAQSTLSKLPTAEHLIAFLPGVSRSYTTQEPFLVFSKGAPIFYINNRRIRNVEEVMRISPSEVESVSIETQPGAEFDNSIGAVIYIQLKKKQGDGLSGSLFNGEDFKQGQFVEGGVELNYRKGKTDVFLVTEANLNFATRRNSTEELTVSTPLQQWQVQTSNEAKNNRRKLSTRLGLNHELSDKHSVGLKLSASTSPLGGHDRTTQETATYRNALLTAQAANAYDRLYKDYNIDGNAYYDGQLSPNLKMQTDLDYRYAHSDHHTTIEERDLLGGMGPLQMRNLATQSDAELRWGAVKTTFNQSLGKTMEQSPYVSQRNYGDTNMRALRLGLEYRFNPTQSKYKGQGTGSEQKERM
jgi:hypothetical protein